MSDTDELYALTSYYAERWSEPNVSDAERDTLLVTFLAHLSALDLYRPSARRLVWSETDPHERIRQWFQRARRRAEDANGT